MKLKCNGSQRGKDRFALKYMRFIKHAKTSFWELFAERSENVMCVCVAKKECCQRNGRMSKMERINRNGIILYTILYFDAYTESVIHLY